MDKALSYEVAKAAMQDGGVVDFERIRKVMKGEIPSYTQDLKSELKNIPKEERYHFVVESVRDPLKAAVAGTHLEDNVQLNLTSHNGTEVTVEAQELIYVDGEYRPDPEAEFKEVGDILMDAEYILGAQINQRRVDAPALDMLKQVYGEAMVNEVVGQNPQGLHMPTIFEGMRVEATRMGLDTDPIEGIAAVHKEEMEKYQSRHRIMESGKKQILCEFQASMGQVTKLIGNVSDTSQDVASLEEGTVNMAIHKLAMLDAVRWGVGVDNLAGFGSGVRAPANDNEPYFTAEQFQQSINKRSYQNEIRAELDLSEMSVEEAQRRMDAYEEGMKPLVEFTHAQRAFFQAADNYKQAHANLYVEHETAFDKELAYEQRNLASQTLKEEVKSVLMSEDMTPLRDGMGFQSNAQIEDLANEITAKLQSSIKARYTQETQDLALQKKIEIKATRSKQLSDYLEIDASKLAGLDVVAQRLGTIVKAPLHHNEAEAERIEGMAMTHIAGSKTGAQKGGRDGRGG